ncbi:MAG: dethiobiotin synthase [Oscillospiraceae bacterium]|nr:dethiobiotin synthase [Oscillospiraceae bacterium]
MSKGIFITATGTDVGKTYVTGLIVKKLVQNGINAGYYKAALSGAENVNGTLIPGDADFVRKTAGLKTMPTVSYIYKNAVSPHLAAKIEGNPVELSIVKSDFTAEAEKYDYITVEGSGGIICPIRYDEQKIFLEDIIKSLGLSALIVADAGLGTINSVVLTVEYMRSRNIKINGIIFNNFHKGNVMEEDNLKMTEEITGIKVIAAVSENSENLDIDINSLLSLYEEV